MLNSMMKNNEIEAILQYVEFHLIQLVESTERHIQDPDVIGGMYEQAHRALDDIRYSLETQQQFDGSDESAPKHTS